MKIVKRCTKKSKVKKTVAMAKGHAHEDLCARLETKVRRSCTDWLGREAEQGKMYSTCRL